MRRAIQIDVFTFLPLGQLMRMHSKKRSRTKTRDSSEADGLSSRRMCEGNAKNYPENR